MQPEIGIGEKYGRFTVIADAPRNRFGARCFRCRCECGNEADYAVSVITGKPDRFCKKCVPHAGGKPKPDLVGKTINGWEVIEEDTHEHGVYYFKCRCLRCGNLSIKTPSQLSRSRSGRCDRCPPIYSFDVRDGAATGHLPDGSEFIIDEEDIPLVQQFFWALGKDDYVAAKRQNLKLHRFIAGVSDPAIMIDHINRNRRDCRKSNLRVISPFGNSCNHSPFQTNKTGYTGVYFSKNSGRYEVKVGYNRRRILLGSSKDDLVTLAQMYNIGASFFFGEYAGALNDVPAPPDELVKRIITKCQKYMKAPAIAGASAA